MSGHRWPDDQREWIDPQGPTWPEDRPGRAEAGFRVLGCAIGVFLLALLLLSAFAMTVAPRP